MQSIKTSVRFFFPERKIALSERVRLRRFLVGLFRKEKHSLEALHYIFCSDEHLRDMNNRFLGHDYYTDILTFDLSEIRGRIRGEVYISIDRVKENAQNLGISFKNEIHRVIFHGALHLCGFKDKKPPDRQKMRKMEDRYLDLYFH